MTASPGWYRIVADSIQWVLIAALIILVVQHALYLDKLLREQRKQREESAAAVRALRKRLSERGFLRREAPAGTSVERQAEMWRTGQLDA